MTLQGGFQSEMNRREAAQILGVRESAAEVSRSMCHLMPSSAICSAAGRDLDCVQSSVGLFVCCPPGLGRLLVEILSIQLPVGCLLATGPHQGCAQEADDCQPPRCRRQQLHCGKGQRGQGHAAWKVSTGWISILMQAAVLTAATAGIYSNAAKLSWAIGRLGRAAVGRFCKATVSQAMPLGNCHPGLQKQSDIPVFYSDEALQSNSRAAAGCQGYVKRITSVIGICQRWALDTSDCVLVKL